MPNDQEDDLEMQMYTALGKHERQHGKAANEALLKQFGVTRATDIPPEDFEKAIRACSKSDEAPRQSARASNDDDHEDDAPRRRPVRANSNARTPLPMETVINAAPDIKSGLNMAAKAIHAKRPK